MITYYDEIANGYDELHGAEQDEKLLQFLERIPLQDNWSVLDIGCGTGRSAKILAQRAEMHWHGIDPSRGLLAHAPPELQSRLRQAAAENLPYGDASFDLLLSLTALQNFNDARKGLQEMRRVAKPGARIFISFLKRSPRRELFTQLIHEELQVIDQWEQSKDDMFICIPRNGKAI